MCGHGGQRSAADLQSVGAAASYGAVPTGNTSLDHVTMDLHMPTQIWDSEVTVQWYLDSWKYLEPDGTLKNEGLEEPVWIQVQALLNFGEENLTWNRTIQICPPEAPDTAMMVRMLQYELKECHAG